MRFVRIIGIGAVLIVVLVIGTRIALSYSPVRLAYAKFSCYALDERACRAVGDYYWFNSVSDESPIMASKYYLRGCGYRELHSCDQLNYLYSTGQTGDLDEYRIGLSLWLACEIDDPEFCGDIDFGSGWPEVEVIIEGEGVE